MYLLICWPLLLAPFKNVLTKRNNPPCDFAGSSVCIHRVLESESTWEIIISENSFIWRNCLLWHPWMVFQVGWYLWASHWLSTFHCWTVPKVTSFESCAEIWSCSLLLPFAPNFALCKSFEMKSSPFTMNCIGILRKSWTSLGQLYLVCSSFFPLFHMEPYNFLDLEITLELILSSIFILKR